MMFSDLCATMYAHLAARAPTGWDDWIEPAGEL
jgi:hypothetical protein